MREAIAVTDATIQNFGKAFQQTTPTPTSTVAYNAQQPPAVQQTLDPEAYITGRDALMLQRQAMEQVAPQWQQSIDLASSANYGIVQQKYQKEFSRYGPEIVAKLNNVPRHLWTLDNLDTVVKLVRADHLTELAREEAQQLVSQMEPTMRSIGNAGSAPVPEADKTNSLESEKIPAEWKLRAQREGLTDATIDEFCRVNEMDRADFFKLFERGQVVTEGAAR